MLFLRCKVVLVLVLVHEFTYVNLGFVRRHAGGGRVEEAMIAAATTLAPRGPSTDQTKARSPHPAPACMWSSGTLRDRGRHR